jgi:TrmH family RNA methyltransferase
VPETPEHPSGGPHPAEPAVETIRSRQNPRVQEARKIAHDPRHARREGVLVADGITVVHEGLASGFRARMLMVVADDPDVAPILKEAKRRHAVVTPVARAILESVSTLAAPQGAIAFFERPRFDLSRLLTAPKASGWPVVAILHGLQDPTNAGSLIRTGLAAGVQGFVTTTGTVDPYHVRAVRASMGACFRMSIATEQGFPVLLEALRRARYRLLSLDPRGEVEMKEIRSDQPIAILLGREGSGLDTESRRACEANVRIPMAEGVESLGVAAAGAIVFYSLLMR